MHLHYKFYRLSKTQVKLAFGLMMGFGTIISMLMAVRLDHGGYLDLRWSLLAVSAIFGGPLAACVTMPMAMAFRVLMGGASTMNGLIAILVVTLSCVALHYLLGRRATGPRGIVIATVSVMLLSVGLGLLFSKSGLGPTFFRVTLPMALLNGVATAVATAVISYFDRFTKERDILRAALTQAPDFHYVKNLDSEFVVTNLNVARHNGRRRSSEMVGLSDFDIVSADRAQKLFEAEQQLMRDGERVTDEEECLLDELGHEKWYSSSKVTLRNRQGEVIGLAGVTRDITSRKTLEKELRDSRNILSQAMAEMSDGLAMFNADGILVFCNDQYKAAFPLSAYAREPGAHITDILRAAVRNGERKDIPTNVGEEWLRSAAMELFADRDTEIPLYDDRWLSLRTRLGSDGSALVVVSDMTAIKQSEQSLKQLADRMKGLAETDGLTGVSNRRAFDEAILEECARAERRQSHLSLLLVDVDRFKAYNDTYGHPAGDACLKTISACLRAAAKRPTDVVARYGGEEFAVLLPGSDLAGAKAVAEAFQIILADHGLVHSGSEFGTVTASVGISEFGMGCDPDALIAAADEALYQAKEQGRNQVQVSARQRYSRGNLAVSG